MYSIIYHPHTVTGCYLLVMVVNDTLKIEGSIFLWDSLNVHLFYVYVRTIMSKYGRIIIFCLVFIPECPHHCLSFPVHLNCMR